jgi:hypothetical protein
MADENKKRVSWAAGESVSTSKTEVDADGVVHGVTHSECWYVSWREEETGSDEADDEN